MQLSNPNHTMLRGILAGIVVLSGASACSRADKADRGPDNTASSQTAPAVTTGGQVTAAQPSESSATTTSAGDTTPTVAQAPGKSRTTSPRARTATPVASKEVEGDSSVQSADHNVSGYSGMERDTSMASGNDSDSSTVASTDSSVAANQPAAADTAAAGYAEMAQDSASTVEDSASTVEADIVEAQGDVAGSVRVDTSTADTVNTSMADTSAAVPADVAVQERTDTAVAVGDSSETGKTADRVRPPEDSTETLGSAAAGAPVGDMVTDAEAVGLMTRQGLRCIWVESPSDDSDTRWDMANSPASLNPCGTGTMTLSRVRTEKK